MKKRVYVDYENMANITTLPKIDGMYYIFLGSSQERLPKALVITAQDNNGRFVEIVGNGKNALDFHIAYQLGVDTTENKADDTQYYILSKDSGFDPLVSYLRNKFGNRVFRIVSLDDLQEKNDALKTPAKKYDEKNYQKVRKHLKDIAKTKRPKSETKLVADIRSVLRAENPSEDEIKLVIDELYRTGFISKANKSITYSE